MTDVKTAKIFTYPPDLAGKRRSVITLDDGSTLMLKYVFYTQSGMQAEVDKYKAWKAAEPARILAEKLVRIRQEMAENGITELK
jgi:hypothetical protein